MRTDDVKELGAYALVSVLAVGAAFALSLKFVGSLRAQEEEPSATQQEQAAPNPPAQNQPAQNQRIQNAPPIPDAGGAGLAASSNSGIAELEGFLEPFIYDVANRRDPFLAFAEFIPQEEGPLRALTPAQRYALEELRLVGVMWEVKDPKAMFMDPDDEVLVLGRDESIGNRNGYIAAIREGEVVVVEAIRKRGDIIYRTRVLRIER
jgi:type IV pilus assembly protein PilP